MANPRLLSRLLLCLYVACGLNSESAPVRAQVSPIGAVGGVLSLSASAVVSFGNVQAVTAGGEHTCALTNGGGVKCWGSDFNGQVGNGVDNAYKVNPVDVSGLTSGVAAITAGFSHTCALTKGGGVKCWGNDAYGQVGDGADGEDKLTPVDVVGLSSGVKAISAGAYHTCALTSGGGVKCWGYDFSGQIGDGADNGDKATPVNVVGLSTGVLAIAAGGYHTCALTSGGGLKCWGWDASGQVGDGDAYNGDKATPVGVVGLSTDVSAIAAGAWHTCALTKGGVKCWGSDVFGQVGDGPYSSDKVAPTSVSGLTSGVTAIATGGNHTCALTSAGGVKCWGNDGSGQVGDGSNKSSKLTPVAVSGLASGVIAIVAGFSHTCALTRGGGVKCWGYDLYGQVGDGPDNSNKGTPVCVTDAEAQKYLYLPQVRH